MYVLFGRIFLAPGENLLQGFAVALKDFRDAQQFKANPETAGQGARIVDRAGRRIGSGHAHANHVFRPQGLSRDAGGEGGIDATAESDDHALEAAFANVVTRAQDECCIRAGFLPWYLLVHLAGQLVGIEVNQVFFKRLALRDHLAGGIQNQAGTVKHQVVIAADLIDHGDRDLVLPGDRGQHLAAQLTLAQPERGRGNIQHEVAAGLDQRLRPDPRYKAACSRSVCRSMHPRKW